MRKYLIALSLSLISNSIIAQNQGMEVMTLGTFHFNFPNLDVEKTNEEDQIDVIEPQYQKEIENIVNKLAGFKPTVIVIEREPHMQKEYDSLYNRYLQGNHTLSRSEEQQLGFRLAKKLGLDKLYCVDAWGAKYPDVEAKVYGRDSIAKQNFMNFFYKNPDTLKRVSSKQIFKTQGILAELKRLNNDNELKQSLGDYLIGIFKYETEDNPYFGVDFVTGWWFSRNLRIFRNIQKINAEPNDRMLVIFGAGHMNLLNIFFEASPEYRLVKVNDYLE